MTPLSLITPQQWQNIYNTVCSQHGMSAAAGFRFAEAGTRTEYTVALTFSGSDDIAQADRQVFVKAMQQSGHRVLAQTKRSATVRQADLISQFLEAKYIRCVSIAATATEISLDQRTDNLRFRVVYGPQVRDGLTYNEAARELGGSILHALAADGHVNLNGP